jgi:hypothetical protein
MPDDLEPHPSEGRDGNASNVVLAGIRPGTRAGLPVPSTFREPGGHSVPMSRHDEYIAKLEAAFLIAVERARLASADEVEPLNKLLDEYLVEMERAGEISTEEELQLAWVTAPLLKLALDAIKKQTRVYLLAQAANPPEVKFVNISGKSFNTIHASDFSFFEEVNHVVQEEPTDAIDAETLGLLASIGIQKGKPFAPDVRMKKILSEAAAVGNATACALSFHPRDPRYHLYPNSSWVNPFISGAHFLDDGARNLDARTFYYFLALGISPAQSLKLVGAGSQVDDEGDPEEQPDHEGQCSSIPHLLS